MPWVFCFRIYVKVSALIKTYNYCPGRCEDMNYSMFSFEYMLNKGYVFCIVCINWIFDMHKYGFIKHSNKFNILLV